MESQCFLRRQRFFSSDVYILLVYSGVGVSEDANDTLLLNITTSDLIFELGNFGDLSSAVSVVSDNICPYPFTEHPMNGSTPEPFTAKSTPEQSTSSYSTSRAHGGLYYFICWIIKACNLFDIVNDIHFIIFTVV